MTHEAELELEIARLREALILMLHEAESYGQAWARAYVREYQELLPGSAKEQFDLLAIMHRRLDIVGKAILTQPSTTALQDLITEVERRTIERCAEVAHNFWLDQVDDSTESAQRAIRALPTGNLKLEDL